FLKGRCLLDRQAEFHKNFARQTNDGRFLIEAENLHFHWIPGGFAGNIESLDRYYLGEEIGIGISEFVGLGLRVRKLRWRDFLQGHLQSHAAYRERRVTDRTELPGRAEDGF